MRRPLFYSLVEPLLLIACALAIACAIVPQTRRVSLPTPSPTPTHQSPTPDSSDAINRPTSKPYTGSLSTFEDPKRDQDLQVNRVMDILGIKEGANVADIGAGSGWFTVRAARQVGSSGVVYAEDACPRCPRHLNWVKRVAAK